VAFAVASAEGGGLFIGFFYLLQAMRNGLMLLKMSIKSRKDNICDFLLTNNEKNVIL